MDWNKNFKIVLLIGFGFFSVGFYPNGIPKLKRTNQQITASISGTTTVCKDQTPLPTIILSASGGDAPYTFSYQINSGEIKEIITSGSETAVEIEAPTDVIGEFSYALTAVKDSNDEEILITGQVAKVTVNDLPEIDFTFEETSSCSGSAIQFNATVSTTEPLTFQWSFGDGITSDEANPLHLFSFDGCGSETVNVTLTVTDNFGCTNAVSQAVTVKRKPLLDFVDLDSEFTNSFENCNSESSLYTVNVGNQTVNTECITSYSVDWGDGTSEEEVTFPLTHIYQEQGFFQMAITAFGDDGCSETVNYEIKNANNPSGGLVNPGSTTGLCLPVDVIEFAISNWGENPDDTFYAVDYGDGVQKTYSQSQLLSSIYYNADNPALSANFPIPHVYTEPTCPDALYFVTLIVSNSCGESEFSAGPIEILEKPTVDFEVNNNEDLIACVGTTLEFNYQPMENSNSICDATMTFYWDFGDGAISSEMNPSYQYTNPGTYDVSLYTENSCGESEPIVKQICIEEPAIAQFTTEEDELCSPLTLKTNNLTELTNNCSSNIFSWEIIYTNDSCSDVEQWNFSNGTNQNSENPEFEFISSGTYIIQLTVKNDCGISTFSKEVAIKKPPAVNLSATSDLCGPSSINPAATVQGCDISSELLTYVWSFPGGIPATSTDFDPGTISYSVPGEYTYSLTVTNSCGSTTESSSFLLNQIPNITNTNTLQNFCSSILTDPINLTSNLEGTTFEWTSEAPAVLSGYLASGTDNIIPAQNIVNSSDVEQTLTYTVTPMKDNCTGPPTTFEYLIRPFPVIIEQPIGISVCLNEDVNELSITHTEGTEPASYQWYENTTDDTTTGIPIPGATSSVYTPVLTDIGIKYYYVVISFGSDTCKLISASALINVIDGVKVASQPLSTQTVCSGTSIDPLTISITDEITSYSYKWYTNTTNSILGGNPIQGATSPSYTPTTDAPGTYYYYVKVSAVGSGCDPYYSETAEVVVLDSPVIKAQPLKDQSKCLNTPSEALEVTISPDQIGDITYQWFVNDSDSTNGATPIVGATNNVYVPSTTTAGNQYYFCEIEFGTTACTITTKISSVVVLQEPIIINQPQSDIYCFGETLQPLSVSYEGGNSSPTYQWFLNTANENLTGTAITDATSSTYVPDGDTFGTFYYYCLLTFNETGCQDIITDVAEITINENAIINDGSSLICSGNVFTYGPEISNGDILPAGTLYRWDAPVVSPPSSVTGASEQISPTDVITQNLTNTTSEVATVTYSISPITGNCTGPSFDVLVTVNPKTNAVATIENNSCNQSNDATISISISGGIPLTSSDPYQILWTGPNGFTSTESVLTNLEVGDYVLNIEEAGNCSFTETYTITEPDVLAFETILFDPESISCFGADDGAIASEIIGGSPPYQFNWTKDGEAYSNDQDLNNLGPGNYTLTVQDSKACGPISQNFVLTEPDEIQINLLNKIDVLCRGENTGVIEVEVLGGRPEYQLLWTGPDGFSSNNALIVDLFAGNYTLELTDRSGCIQTFKTRIKQNPAIKLQYETLDNSCYQSNDGAITLGNISGGVSPYTVVWSNSGSGMSQTNLSADTYEVSIIDSVGCVQKFPIVVNEPLAFDIDPVVTQLSCFGENDASIALNLISDNTLLNVVWDDDLNAGVERNNLAPGTYNVSISDGKLCEIVDSFTIFEVEPLALFSDVTHPLDCNDNTNGAIDMMIQGGQPPYTILWSNGAVTEDLQNLTPAIYYVTVTDSKGCEINGQWEVNRFTPLEVSVDTKIEFDCEAKTSKQTFFANASYGEPPYQYTWSSGTISGDNNNIMNTAQNGNVTLLVTDNLGCQEQLNFNVDLIELGEQDFFVNSNSLSSLGFHAVQDPVQFTNTSTGDYDSVEWDFGDGNISIEENPTHIYTAEGTYIIKQSIKYDLACVFEKETILIITKGYRLMIPNAFTPNGDNFNDYFVPNSVGLTSLRLDIYDTWGRIIFSEMGDNIQGWDGLIDGYPSMSGSYYYKFSGITITGKTILREGVLTYLNLQNER